MANNYRKIDNITYLLIRHKGVEYESIIDTTDLENVLCHNWYLNNCGYAVTNLPSKIGRGTMFLHHLILPKKKCFEIDHINRVRLDNRKKNLRYATRKENILNTNKRKDSNNLYKGVRKLPSGRYGASLQHNGKRSWLGTCSTELEASNLYKIAVSQII